MKRMYGEQRQSVVLKNEIDDIRDKYDSLAANYMYRPQFSPRSAFVDPLAPQQQLPAYHTKLSPTPSTTSTTVHVSPETPAGQAEPSAVATSNVTDTPPPLETVADLDMEETTTAAKSEEVPPVAAKQETKKEADQAEPPTSSPTSGSSTTTATYAHSNEGSFETEPIEKKGVNACPVKEEVITQFTVSITNNYAFN